MCSVPPICAIMPLMHTPSLHASRHRVAINESAHKLSKWHGHSPLRPSRPPPQCLLTPLQARPTTCGLRPDLGPHLGPRFVHVSSGLFRQTVSPWGCPTAASVISRIRAELPQIPKRRRRARPPARRHPARPPAVLPSLPPRHPDCQLRLRPHPPAQMVWWRAQPQPHPHPRCPPHHPPPHRLIPRRPEPQQVPRWARRRAQWQARVHPPVSCKSLCDQVLGGGLEAGGQRAGWTEGREQEGSVLVKAVWSDMQEGRRGTKRGDGGHIDMQEGRRGVTMICKRGDGG